MREAAVYRPWHDELWELEDRCKAREFAAYIEADGTPVYEDEMSRWKEKGAPSRNYTEEFERLRKLRWRFSKENVIERDVGVLVEAYWDIHARYCVAYELSHGTERDAQIAKLKDEIQLWRDRVEQITPAKRSTLALRIEDQRCATQSTPVLQWDRRPQNPLVVNPRDFFPDQPMALLDMTPRTIWPSLVGDQGRDYDFFEFMAGEFFMYPVRSVVSGLQSLAPGAAEWIIPQCESLRDPKRGGVVDEKVLSVRSLNEEQLREVFEAFMEWPFRPTKGQMLQRMGNQMSEEVPTAGHAAVFDELDNMRGG
jgi:transcription factor 1